MKIKLLAAVLFLGIVVGVILNTLALTGTINEYTDKVLAFEISDENTEEAEIAARDTYAHFKKRETFMSLTVNHNDLTAIEELFSEMIGQLSVGDGDGARVTKNRLIDALSHLRRLSGVNIDSII